MDCATTEDKIAFLKQCVATYPDFPKPGIIFRDIFSLYNNPSALNILNEVVLEYVKSIQPNVQVVVGLESRGFLLGPPIALELGIAFVPIRKKGKLPGKLESVEYTLEYGKEVFEIQTDQIKADTRVLLIDDLLATGGSLAAACHLVSKTGAKIVCCVAVMELLQLKGRDKIHAPVHTFIKY